MTVALSKPLDQTGITVRIDTWTPADREQAIELVQGVQSVEFNECEDRQELHDLAEPLETYVGSGVAGAFYLARASKAGVFADKVVGTIALKQSTTDAGMLKRLYVDAAFRGQKPLGVATKLLEHVKRDARQNGVRFIYLGTIREAVASIHFYLRQGFVECSRGDLPAGSYISIYDTCFFRLDLATSP